MHWYNAVYIKMTKHLMNIQQSAENQAGQGKIFFKNVDILSTSLLTFALLIDIFTSKAQYN